MSTINCWVCCTLSTTAWMVCSASVTITVAVAEWVTDCAIKSLISFAAVELRWARLRTSLATTAKPRPSSPARAASTAAFNANI